MTLLNPDKFDKDFEGFTQKHPELSESQKDLLYLFFRGSARAERVITSNNLAKRYGFSMYTLKGGRIIDHNQAEWLAIEFLGEDITFENPSLDPRKIEWKTEGQIVEAIAQWIIKKSEKYGKPTFPDRYIVNHSDDLPNYSKILEITGCGLVEIFDRLYSEGIISNRYKSRKSITISPRQENYDITGNEAWWRDKEKRLGVVYRGNR